MSEQIPSRPWAVFVDAQTPRILLLAQQAPGGVHWTDVRIDEAISTDHVKVWTSESGPILIEASGLASLNKLQDEVERVTGSGLLWSPTLGDPDVVPTWVWWHDSLAIDPPLPPNVARRREFR